MRRIKRLKKLESNLIILQKKAKQIDKNRIRDDGSVDYEACVELNLILTDISLTKRKIEFSKNGKSYLGNPLSSETPRISEFD